MGVFCCSCAFTSSFYVFLQHPRAKDLFPANIVDYRIALLSDCRISAKYPMKGCPEYPFRHIYRCSGQYGHRNIQEIHTIFMPLIDPIEVRKVYYGFRCFSLHANNHMLHGIRRSIHVFSQDLQHWLPVDIDRLQPVLHPIIC